MNVQARRVLLVEDNKVDVFLVQEAIAAHHIPVDLQVVEDGERAIEWIEQANENDSALPELVLLDLNLPRRSGAEVLAHLKRAPRWRNVPVLIMTSSGSEMDKLETTALGADAYFSKPAGYEAFLKLGEVMLGFFVNHIER